MIENKLNPYEIIVPPGNRTATQTFANREVGDLSWVISDRDDQPTQLFVVHHCEKVQKSNLDSWSGNLYKY